MSEKRNSSQMCEALSTERTFQPYRPLMAERRKPENAPIRRWFKLGEQALEPLALDDDLGPAA
jgi:hypothetical protein